MRVLFFLLLTVFSFTSFTPSAYSSEEMKEWTLLVFLNGHNNLDTYGTLDINEMEKVGSTEDVNVVVQWASIKGGTTKRLYVEKDNDPQNVTSRVALDLGERADMGNYQELINFIEWGVENFPAKHYFVDIWDHGNGWGRELNEDSDDEELLDIIEPDDFLIGIQDISWDDYTGNVITTPELGLAMKEAKEIIGHNVDILGADACLMAMAEVANEVANSVDYFVASQDYEPAKGWDYTPFLEGWVKEPEANGMRVTEILAKTFLASYSGGSHGVKSVTLSSYDLRQIKSLKHALKGLSDAMGSLSKEQKEIVRQAMSDAIDFSGWGYIDVIDLIDHIVKGNEVGIDASVFQTVQNAISKFVVANEFSAANKGANGVSVWFPYSLSNFHSQEEKYRTLKFAADTGWADALESLLSDD